jgi:hypothetical protein
MTAFSASPSISQFNYAPDNLFFVSSFSRSAFIPPENPNIWTAFALQLVEICSYDLLWFSMSRAPSHKCLQHPPAVVAGVHETTLGIRKNKGFTLESGHSCFQSHRSSASRPHGPELAWCRFRSRIRSDSTVSQNYGISRTFRVFSIS